MRGLALEAVAVRPARGGVPLFAPVSLTVAPGETVTLMGSSGSGKSTLLAHLAGFLDPAFRAEGVARLDGVDLSRLAPERRRVGLLFQDDLLFPHLGVGENLLFGLDRSVQGRSARRAAAEAALERAGLAGTFDRDPATLSGGQKARVSLLRTLLAAPRALLLDEPFSRLDAHLRDDVRRFVFERARDEALPTLLVTHDEADVPPGGRVVRLQSAA